MYAWWHKCSCRFLHAAHLWLPLIIIKNPKCLNHEKKLQSVMESCPDVLDIFSLSLKSDVKSRPQHNARRMSKCLDQVLKAKELWCHGVLMHLELSLLVLRWRYLATKLICAYMNHSTALQWRSKGNINVACEYFNWPKFSNCSLNMLQRLEKISILRQDCIKAP